MTLPNPLSQLKTGFSLSRSLPGLLAALSLAVGLFVSSPARADEQILLNLPDEKAFGSGPSILDNLYTPGGITPGLFIGHPNNLNRSDRVLLKYDLKPLLLIGPKVKSAVLLLQIEYYSNNEQPETQLEVEHFQETMDTLTGADLNRPDVDSAAVITVTEDQAINGENGVRGIPPLEIDVTDAVKADLAKGNTTATFRLRAPEIEGKANTALTSCGVVVARGENQRPVLQITLAD